MSAEPTAEQRDEAEQLFDQLLNTYPSDAQRDLIARALAAAVTAEREKYLRVADELDDYLAECRSDCERASYPATRFRLGGMADMAEWAARRIREVTT